MTPLSDELSARIDELESELASDPSPAVFAPLADAYRLSGQLENALSVARRGIAAHPGHVGVRIVFARVVADLHGPGRAREAYRDVLALDPGNIEAQAFLDAIPELPRPTQELDAAPQGLPHDVTEADTDHADEGAVTGESSLGEEAARKQATGAGSLAQELAHLADLFQPASPGSSAPELEESGIATLTLAEIYSRQGLYDKAAEVCERILERDPHNRKARDALEEYRGHPQTA
jgi:tetratricopeptide (TPR) repeat protein